MMNLIRSSNRVLAITFVVVLLGAAGTAAALSVTASNVPEETPVGSETNASITIEDPFTDTPNEWTLEGETQLENVSWTVTVLDQGQQLSQETYGQQSFSQELAREGGGDQIEIEIAGDVPAVEEHSYDPPENYTLAELRSVQGNNTQELTTYSVHHYTNESQSARQEIDAASAAIEDAGGTEDANRSLEQAISAYDNGNFENAISNAKDAQSAAEQAEQSQEQTQMLLYAGVGVVVLLVVIGGVWYWRNQQDDYDKLR